MAVIETSAAVGGAPAPAPGRNEALETAPFWRREPYAILFPLGLVLSWAGVGRWLAFALTGRAEDYLPIFIFHSMAQVQGFLLCFAFGFLFTMIPRRTGSAPPSAIEMVLAVVAPVWTVAAAWAQGWALSQAGWIVACVVLVSFVLRRFASSASRRRPPTSFVWIPVALLLGLVGSLMTGARGTLGEDWMWLHNLGQVLVLQGVFLSLVLGVGGLVFPMMTRGAAPSDATWSARDAAALGGHLLAAVLLVVSFVVQVQVSTVAGCALRAVVLAAVLLFGVELWRFPTVPGWNRRVVWLAGWMMPLGYALAALYPQYYQGALHVSLIGGFAMLTLAVSTHVVLGHGNRSDVINGRPWQVATIALCLLAAMVARAEMAIDPMHRNHWMALAAMFFLAATVVWAVFLIPTMVARARE